MDNKKDIGSPDRDRVNIHEEYELREWAKKFDVTTNELKKAVEAVGTSAASIQEYMKK